ncbi:MAG TPA: hypothetical protein VK762_10195, partial [Polyangiaceae bacterium]|nr:hypothetical protein [Polyangiaceae bacterium]
SMRPLPFIDDCNDLQAMPLSFDAVVQVVAIGLLATMARSSSKQTSYCYQGSGLDCLCACSTWRCDPISDCGW